MPHTGAQICSKSILSHSDIQRMFSADGLNEGQEARLLKIIVIFSVIKANTTFGGEKSQYSYDVTRKKVAAKGTSKTSPTKRILKIKLWVRPQPEEYEGIIIPKSMERCRLWSNHRKWCTRWCLRSLRCWLAPDSVLDWSSMTQQSPRISSLCEVSQTTFSIHHRNKDQMLWWSANRILHTY